MCPDGTKCRQGSPDAPDATSWGAWVQDAQDAQDAKSRLGESGRNTPVSDAGHLFADEAPQSTLLTICQDHEPQDKQASLVLSKEIVFSNLLVQANKAHLHRRRLLLPVASQINNRIVTESLTQEKPLLNHQESILNNLLVLRFLFIR